jgi:hypothetical protein
MTWACGCQNTCYGYHACDCNGICYGEPGCIGCDFSCFSEICTCNGSCYDYTTWCSTCDSYTGQCAPNDYCICNSEMSSGCDSYNIYCSTCDNACYGYGACTCNQWSYNYSECQSNCDVARYGAAAYTYMV